MATDSIARALSGQANKVATDAIAAAEEAIHTATEQIPSIVTEWLDDNVTPVGSAVVVDSSLSISGAAADAKATGDGLTNLKNAIFSVLQEDATEIIASSSSPADLNEYLTPGNYAIKTAQSSNNIQNGPVTGYGYRLLIFQTTASTRVVQIAFINSTPSSEIAELKMAIRNYTGTWSDWQFMASQSLVDAMKEIVKAAITTKAGERTIIPNNTDYNTLTTPGNYYANTAASLATMTNLPEGVANHVLCVLNGPTSVTTYQIIVDNLNNIYIRGKLNENSSFTNWCHFIKSDEFDKENGKIGDAWEQGRVLTDGSLATVSYAIRKKISLGSVQTVWAFDMNEPDTINKTAYAYYFNSSNQLISWVALSTNQTVPSTATYVYVVVMAGSTSASVLPDYGENVLVYLDTDSTLQKILLNIANNYASINSVQAKKISDGTDYNSLVSSGTYIFTGDVSTAVNVPEGVARHFLWVFQGTTAATIHQLILDNNGKIFYRMRLNASNAFTEWELVKGSAETITYPISWAISGCIGSSGGFQADTDPNYKISNPVKLYAGDIVEINGSVTSGRQVATNYYSDRLNRFWASTVGQHPALIIATATGSQTFTATVSDTGYYIFSLIPETSTKLKIKRSYAQQNIVEENEKLTAWNYGETIHNYVDEYDYIPDLTSRKTNSILVYEGDNKVSANHIVNAVAYPDGTIIACRAKSGAVVRIDNVGNETTLLTIANAKDWRGLFMDSNMNVYASPHSTYANPAMTRTDRGLYRLAYGSNSFTKVISLCRSTTAIKKWAANTSFAVGDIVFRDQTSNPNVFYKCITAHTSTTSFNESYFQACPQWAPSTSYTVGSVVKYNNLYFWCATAHTSTSAFDYTKWNAATEYMSNDDTIWTMCEDEIGNLYAGCYAHGDRNNASIYFSSDGGTTWIYQHNFKTCGTISSTEYGPNAVRHVHCVNFNPFDNTLYAAVGEVNTLCKSTDHGQTWVNMYTPVEYGQPTYVMGVKDGLVIGSDGHYACGVSKLKTDGKTMKRCGRTIPGFIFNIRRSDITGWLYAWTRIDNILDSTAECPPMDCVNDPVKLAAWKANTADPQQLQYWENFHAWAEKYYPEDSIRPNHSVIMVSRDEGDTWEVFYKAVSSTNMTGYAGFVTCGYFRDGECLAGFLKSNDNPDDSDYTSSFVNPVIISEGKKKRTSSGYDLSGEIFIKTNSSDIVPW